MERRLQSTEYRATGAMDGWMAPEASRPADRAHACNRLRAPEMGETAGQRRQVTETAGQRRLREVWRQLRPTSCDTARAGAMRSSRDAPNCIVFFTDQQRWDTSSLAGNPQNLTPNFDRMAIHGTHLSQAVTCQPVCGPARAAMQTGMWPTATGCFRNGIGLPKNCPKIAELFRNAGWATAYIGKWHMYSPPSGVNPGGAGTDLHPSRSQHEALAASRIGRGAVPARTLAGRGQLVARGWAARGCSRAASRQPASSGRACAVGMINYFEDAGGERVVDLHQADQPLEPVDAVEHLRATNGRATSVRSAHCEGERAID